MIVPPPYMHCVYLLVKVDRVVIYVGVTSNLFGRLGQHFLAPYWPLVAHVQVESFATRREAEVREAHLIKIIDPFYNVAGTDAGTQRHLEEMRGLINAMRADRAREVESLNPQAPAIELSEIACRPDRGVTLTEAVPHIALGAPMTINALRRASQRAGFPTPIGQRGHGPRAANLYDLDQLKSWKRGRDSRGHLID
jgi:hypothetical protein